MNVDIIELKNSDKYLYPAKLYLGYSCISAFNKIYSNFVIPDDITL